MKKIIIFVLAAVGFLFILKASVAMGGDDVELPPDGSHVASHHVLLPGHHLPQSQSNVHIY